MTQRERIDVTIRLAADADLPALWPIRTDAIRQGCADYYSPELVSAWASVRMPDGFVEALRGCTFLVAQIDGRIQAFGFLDSRMREVEGIFVAPLVHRQGIGSRLMRALEERANQGASRTLRLNASLNAERFYLSHGFSPLARTVWKHPSGFSLPCVLMEKMLTTPGAGQQGVAADGLIGR
jgi:GNAT superfamily N-acetyltransferase